VWLQLRASILLLRPLETTLFELEEWLTSLRLPLLCRQGQAWKTNWAQRNSLPPEDRRADHRLQ